jgi:hypothetical protein
MKDPKEAAAAVEEATPAVVKKTASTVSDASETKLWSEWASIVGVPVALWRGAAAHVKADIDAPVSRRVFESAVKNFAGEKVQ